MVGNGWKWLEMVGNGWNYNVLTHFPLPRHLSSLHIQILVNLFRFVILHLLFLIVGLGSTVFHMTLKYDQFKTSLFLYEKYFKFYKYRHSMQLLDEVPMIWGSCYMLYCMHMVRAASHYITLILGLDQRNIMRFEGERKAGCSEQNSRSVPLDLLHRFRGCVPQCAQPACVSSKYKIPLLFLTHVFLFADQALYGTVVFVMIGQAVRTIKIQNNPQVMSLYTASVLFYLAGFILWNLGNILLINRSLTSSCKFRQPSM